MELYNTRRVDFVVDSDERGEFVEYHKRSSKNGKATLKKYQPEHFCLAIKIYESDVLDTFKGTSSTCQMALLLYF